LLTSLSVSFQSNNGRKYDCKKADVFSAGRVVYAMRFGLPPQPQPNLAAARAECSRELMRVFDTALAVDPNKRNIEQFWEAIKNWSESLRVSS
jgi:serine/threonine protein kinase